MSRPKGSKNRSTILREAEEAAFAHKLDGRKQEFLDSLHVMEEGMRHFFAKAMHAKTSSGRPEIIDANMLQAVSIAEKIAPYRHHRLGAIKLSADPVDPGVRENASLKELQAELVKHWKRLAPVLDLEALMAPADGSARAGQ
jgi:hypothetical protein